MFVISISELELRLGDDSSTCTREVLWSHGPFALESNRNTIDHNGSQIKQLIMLLEPLNKFTSYHNFTVAPFQHSRNTGNNACQGFAVMCQVGAILGATKLPFWRWPEFGRPIRSPNSSAAITCLQHMRIDVRCQCGILVCHVGMLKSCIPTARTLKMKPHHCSKDALNISQFKQLKSFWKELARWHWRLEHLLSGPPFEKLSLKHLHPDLQLLPQRPSVAPVDLQRTLVKRCKRRAKFCRMLQRHPMIAIACLRLETWVVHHWAEHDGQSQCALQSLRVGSKTNRSTSTRCKD